MRDPFFGHRDVFTGEPLRGKDEWTRWDFALVTAFQLVQDLTNKHGLLVFEVENERMDVYANKKFDKFEAARDRATAGSKTRGYTPQPGEYFEPELVLRGGEWPTLAEYWETLAEKADSPREDYEY